MAEFRTDGGGVLCEDLVRKVFEYDDHAEEARTACIAKGWIHNGRQPINGPQRQPINGPRDNLLLLRNELGFGHSGTTQWRFGMVRDAGVSRTMARVNK